jgi:hypothetical protein
MKTGILDSRPDTLSGNFEDLAPFFPPQINWQTKTADLMGGFFALPTSDRKGIT